MTLIPTGGYAGGVGFTQSGNGKRETMIYHMVAQEKVKEAIRQAGRYQLVYEVKQSRKTQKRQWLATLACRFGLNQTGECDNNPVFRPHFDIKEVSLIEPNKSSSDDPQADCDRRLADNGEENENV